MRRLWVQQTLAFSVVIILIVSGVAVWINRSAVLEFRKYITLREVRVPGSGVQELVDHYQRRGSWEGVDALLAEGIYFSADWMGIRLGATLDEIGADERKKAPNFLLTDADGRVVFDSDGEVAGTVLDRSELRNAWPISEPESGETVGYLLVYYPVKESLDGLEGQFLDRIQQVLLIGAGLAVVSIVVIGALLSRRLSAPLQRLADAARAVAAGDLDQQVEVGGTTEVAQVGQAFNEMTIGLKQSQTLRQNMVADVAHELRNPLSVMQGSLWAILNDAYPLDKAEISRLYDETRLLSRLVEDLRELALADAGELQVNVRPTDIAHVVRATAGSLALVAEAQEVSLEVQLPNNLAPAQADPDRIAQVLRNLLLNALRHTPAGGSVTVTTSYTANALEIAVADTGEGIAPQDLPHVFERFWRADPSRSRSGSAGEERHSGGSGLGLAVAQSLVEAQGGRIWAESGLGEGTTFRFTLPLVQPGQ